MNSKQLEELYAKIENYANQVFGEENDNYFRSFRLMRGFIMVHDKACFRYCDSTDDEEYVIAPEDLELPIEEAKEKYQKELQKIREEDELRKAEAELREQKRKEEEEYRQYLRLKEKFF